MRGLENRVAIVTGAAGESAARSAGASLTRRSTSSRWMSMPSPCRNSLPSSASTSPDCSASPSTSATTRRCRKPSSAASQNSASSTCWSTTPAGMCQSRSQTEPAQWDKLIAINLRGALHMHHAVLPAWWRARRARVVNIASDAGRVGSSGEAVYAACKGGLIAFSKTIARELRAHGITVNVVCPGPTDTALLRRLRRRRRTPRS